DLGQARLCLVRSRYIRLWPRRAAEGRRRNAGADRNLHQGPHSGACADAGGVRGLVKNPMVDASKVALIGYCFGGAVGVEVGATGAPLVANISIHGSFRDHEAGWAKNAKGMYLILHGAEDESYPLTTVDRVIQELRAWKVPFQLEVYSGTGHGFSTPKNNAEERANAQSIAWTARTFKELFGI